MSIFTIDPKKCKRDGICAAVCPGRVIAQPTRKDYPSPIPEAEEFCINCGHCVAACPHDALSLSSMPLAACPVIQKDLRPSAESVRQLLTARRSVRCYKTKQAPRRVLQELIDTARYAPTGSNRQPVHWTVIQNPDDVHELAALTVDFVRMMLPVAPDEAAVRRFNRLLSAWEQGLDRILRNAPHLVIVSCGPDIAYPEADCATALAYLELYASAQGLGTCWAGYFTGAANAHQPIKDKIALPDGHQCHGAVMLGYPKYSYRRIPARQNAQITWK